ncbi:hypothetical protein ABZ135_24105 [Streptomyces sp. NPDC006339]|uniref:hypothetical protein n=1 Tax=Streptomyces sp. NPDC006339 TaxID=3156755 RepID=UPI0033A71D01
MKKTLTATLGLALATGSLIAAPSASAASSSVDCEVWKSSTAPYTGYAKCTGMLPYPLEGARVKVICIDPRGSKWTVYGSTQGNGKTSSAKCSDNPSVGIYKVGVERIRL